MIILYVTLAALGLAAIDPVGIAAMPFLLLQSRPLLRSSLFIGGSFTALVIMGLLFASGLGRVVLQYQVAYSWVVPLIEIAAGCLLAIVAVALVYKGRRERTHELPSAIRRKLEMGYLHLFIFGAVLVMLQSVVDVVFVLAMIRMQQLELSLVAVVGAVCVYALAALAIQIGIVVMYCIATVGGRQQLPQRIELFTLRYTARTALIASLMIGCGLVANGLLALGGYAHL